MKVFSCVIYLTIGYYIAYDLDYYKFKRGCSKVNMVDGTLLAVTWLPMIVGAGLFFIIDRPNYGEGRLERSCKSLN